MSDIRLEVNMNQFASELSGLQSRTEAAVQTLCDTVARKMESWAKDNARWQNRTGNARQGLTGSAVWQDTTTIWIVVSHSVDYGIWLELAKQRKYAILEEAVEQNKDELMNGLQRLLG